MVILSPPVSVSLVNIPFSHYSIYWLVYSIISEYFKINKTIYLRNQRSTKIRCEVTQFPLTQQHSPKPFTDSAVSCRRHDFLKRWKCWAQFFYNTLWSPKSGYFKSCYFYISRDRIIWLCSSSGKVDSYYSRILLIKIVCKCTITMY